jgi:transcription elongation factor GreA
MAMETIQEKKFYLTKEGLGKIKKEFEELKGIKLAKTRGDVPKMLQSEDVDSEYISFQEDMELLERKLQELDAVLKNYEIIKPPAGKKADTVYLGGKVFLQDNSGNKIDLKIVGTLEADPFAGKISNESPVGRALLGRKVGEVVNMKNPANFSYKVLKVYYGEI